MASQKIVFVGMSGGVDSSVAAYLLKQQGYFVVGVFIKVWHPPFLRCHWEDERLDAMRVAAFLDIPFMTCDAEAEYERDVAEYFIDAYRNGETPNPDVMCNTYVKFGAFHRFAKMHGADHIATGHYARLGGEHRARILMRAIDPKKDQSYFLWNAPSAALDDSLFPLGNMTKDQVRAVARKAGIPTAEKRDSQGICFLGQVDIPEFLSHYLELVPGDLLNEGGKVIGTHQGALVYTIGQRHGFTVADNSGAPHYVVARDLKKNTVTVSSERPVSLSGERIRVRGVRTFIPLHCGDTYDIETRYHGVRTGAIIESLTSDEVILMPLEPMQRAASGQSLVISKGDQIVAGGIIGGYVA